MDFKDCAGCKNPISSVNDWVYYSVSEVGPYPFQFAHDKDKCTQRIEAYFTELTEKKRIADATFLGQLPPSWSS